VSWSHSERRKKMGARQRKIAEKREGKNEREYGQKGTNKQTRRA
jgi:hypothetical protein